MKGVTLSQSAGAAWTLAAALWLVLSVRFATNAVGVALSGDTGSGHPQSHRTSPPQLTSSAARVASTPESSSSARRSPRPAAGPSLRLPVLVSGSEERSDVRVNGKWVGHSPFLGEVTCKVGQTITVDVLPPGKVPRHYVRECVSGAQIRITQ